jgi:hypothetical protein
MAFLRPHFEYDTFVSYSHGVRVGDSDAPLKDWTLELIRKLETDIRLVDTEFDDLQIWRDDSLPFGPGPRMPDDYHYLASPDYARRVRIR